MGLGRSGGSFGKSLGRMEEEEVAIMHLTPRKPAVSFADLQIAPPGNILEPVVCKRDSLSPSGCMLGSWEYLPL